MNLCTLLTQRRMRPEISHLLRQTLYRNLRDGQNVFQHPPLSGFQNSLWFFDHNWPENQTDDQSSTNKLEAEMVLQLVKYAMRHGYIGERLAVITPYVGQLLLLKKIFSNSRMTLFIGDADMDALDVVVGNGAGETLELDEGRNVSVHESVRLATVDNFQGEEADLVIVSTVRCNRNSRTGFLKEDNRVNVMLSRAKHGMIVLGNKDTILGSKNGPKLFGDVVREMEVIHAIDSNIRLQCKAHGRITTVQAASDIPIDGGCTEICGARKQCGHSCVRKCHPDDMNHIVSVFFVVIIIIIHVFLIGQELS